MRHPGGIFFTCFVMALLTAIDVATAQEKVGEVTRADDISLIERLRPERILEPGMRLRDILENDTVASEGGVVQLKLKEKIPRPINVVVREGSLHVENTATGLRCAVTGHVKFQRNRVRYVPGEGSIENSCEILAGGNLYKSILTEFLINARGYETSLFVMEGAVEVSYADPEIPKNHPEWNNHQIVQAGEWLITRKGEEIPEPKRYRLSNPESGSSECIYSNCKLTDKVPIPPPPVYTPAALIPPPPNPPGQR